MNKKVENKNGVVFPKLLIIGNGQHGKDTVAEIFRDEFGMTFKSSSFAASEIFLYDALKDKYGYDTPEECFNDRAMHRAEWYRRICDYNKDDKARLAKSILEEADCYVGMRDIHEINACLEQGIFDLVIWVDAAGRLPLEGADSFNIDKSCADIIIENKGTLEELIVKVKRLGGTLTNYEMQD